MMTSRSKAISLYLCGFIERGPCHVCQHSRCFLSSLCVSGTHGRTERERKRSLLLVFPLHAFRKLNRRWSVWEPTLCLGAFFRSSLADGQPRRLKEPGNWFYENHERRPFSLSREKERPQVSLPQSAFESYGKMCFNRGPVKHL